MTIGVQFQVKSVAIIGAGPSGLATLYELLHTSREGISSVGGASSDVPAFEEVVVFEQKNKSGGIWAPYYDDPGYPLPPQELLETSEYNNPDVIHPKVNPQGELMKPHSKSQSKLKLLIGSRSSSGPLVVYILICSQIFPVGL